MPTAQRNFFVFKTGPVVRDMLEELKRISGRPGSAVIRALILAAKPDDLPRSWLNVPDDERKLVALAEGRN